jgi:hypothetical protein
MKGDVLLDRLKPAKYRQWWNTRRRLSLTFLPFRAKIHILKTDIHSGHTYCSIWAISDIGCREPGAPSARFISVEALDWKALCLI